jgi:GNAT superfamily N-acetyltransferase
MSMHEPPVRVTPVDDRCRPLLCALHPSLSQHGYVGTVSDMLADAAACTGSEAMAIWHGDSLAGCYRIDANTRSISDRAFDQPARALRSFLIDAAWQRRGVGTMALAALLVDLARRHRETRLLALAVHEGNGVALRLYRRAGFLDHGTLYHGGRAGPQLLLLRTLPRP